MLVPVELSWHKLLFKEKGRENIVQVYDEILAYFGLIIREGEKKKGGGILTLRVWRKNP